MISLLASVNYTIGALSAGVDMLHVTLVHGPESLRIKHETAAGRTGHLDGTSAQGEVEQSLIAMYLCDIAFTVTQDTTEDNVIHISASEEQLLWNLYKSSSGSVTGASANFAALCSSFGATDSSSHDETAEITVADEKDEAHKFLVYIEAPMVMWRLGEKYILRLSWDADAELADDAYRFHVEFLMPSPDCNFYEELRLFELSLSLKAKGFGVDVSSAGAQRWALADDAVPAAGYEVRDLLDNGQCSIRTSCSGASAPTTSCSSAR